MNTTLAPITDNQIQMLRALLVKKGWSEAYFGWKLNKQITELTKSEAKDWISRLTKETKGKPKPTTLLEPPADAPLAIQPRRKVEPAGQAEPVPVPVTTPATTPPSADTEDTITTMMQQLQLVGEPTRQTMRQVVAEVGVQAAFAAVMQTLQAQSKATRLTALEQWTILARQLGGRHR